MSYRFKGMHDLAPDLPALPDKMDLVTYGMVGVAVLIAFSAFRSIFGRFK